jgi:hypothetical protein
MLSHLPRQLASLALVTSGAATVSSGCIGWSHGGLLGAATAVLLVWAVVAGLFTLSFGLYCWWTAEPSPNSELDGLVHVGVGNDATLH